MMKLIFLILSIIFFSCQSDHQESQQKKIGQDTLSTTLLNRVNIEKVRFDFTAVYMDSHKEKIEIKASLYNDDSDTVYFLSSSCDGEQYSLRYDTSKWVLTPFLNCNASYPRLIKIAPHSIHSFKAHFRADIPLSKIKLGFDFYMVDKSFDFSKLSLDAIHQREENRQTILWTGEKMIL